MRYSKIATKTFVEIQEHLLKLKTKTLIDRLKKAKVLSAWGFPAEGDIDNKSLLESLAAWEISKIYFCKKRIVRTKTTIFIATRDRKAGNIIEYFKTREEAEKAIEEYEKEDMENDIYKSNSYEVAEVVPAFVYHIQMVRHTQIDEIFGTVDDAKQYYEHKISYSCKTNGDAIVVVTNDDSDEYPFRGYAATMRTDGRWENHPGM